MSVHVLKPGLLTTLQDRGRHGHAALGIGSAGAMDDVALRLANALVGNADDAAALEITVLGPRLRFDSDTMIALTGADFDARLNGNALPTWRPQPVAAGDVLECGQARRGARAYLAVAGGFMAEPVLGSRATDLNAGLGPFGGRALHSGDELQIGPAATARTQPHHHAWSLDPRPWSDPDTTRPVRLVCGRHFDALDRPSQEALCGATFHVAADSNRVGFRLDGPRLAFAAPLELVSEAVATGTLQLPPGGQPIALMAEHPTTGGYPRIGQIAAIDLPRLAQRRPGERVVFRKIGLDEAQTRYLERERELERLFESIRMRLAG